MWGVTIRWFDVAVLHLINLKEQDNALSLFPHCAGNVSKYNIDFFTMMGLFFFCFYQNGVRLKKITNLGKSCQLGTTSYAEVVPIRHDFCHVILKSCQLGTTSALSYWSRANLAWLLPRHTEVVSTWHDFCHVIIVRTDKLNNKIQFKFDY